MGPLYGSLFIGMADAVRGRDDIDAAGFARLLRGGLTSLQDITDAGVGDKCLMDTLIPAVEAFEQAHAEHATFSEALGKMKSAASRGEIQHGTWSRKSAGPAASASAPWARWTRWTPGRCHAA